jgi:hypothetical protein
MEGSEKDSAPASMDPAAINESFERGIIPPSLETTRNPNTHVMTLRRPNELAQVKFLEKVVSLIVDDNKGREIFHLNAPNGLHAKLRVSEHLDFRD